MHISKRTKAALVFLTGSALLLAADTAQSPFFIDFAKRWQNARKLAVEVAEAMPAADYGFKPTSAEMTFGEQMTHIAEANERYCSAMVNKKSTLHAPDHVTRDEAIKLVGDSFDYCSDIVKQLNDADLEMQHPDKVSHDTRDFLFGLLVHMAHHRGQAEVYLRLKGITPPKYIW